MPTLKQEMEKHYGNARLKFMRRWTNATFNDNRVKGRCFYCGVKLTEDPGKIEFKTVEHVYPQHRWPKLKENTVKACIGCNGAKNGFGIYQLRRYFDDEEFFCEKILMQRIPEPDDALIGDLQVMIDNVFKTKIHPAIAMRMDSKRLKKKLQQIIEEAKLCLKNPRNP